MRTWTRRAFIGTGTLAGGGLLLGVAGIALAPSRHSIVPHDPARPGALTTWITIAPDNIVTVLVPHCDMGQGSQTALAMMAAEELEADWDLVRIAEAPALDAYANAYILRPFIGDAVPAPFVRALDYGTYRLANWYGLQLTAASTAVRGTGQYGMAVAGAAAREMLIAEAAARLGVSPSACVAERSHVVHRASGSRVSFGALATGAAARRVPDRPALKDPAAYTIRRTPRQRADIPAKVDGRTVYGIDMTLPGMLHAALDLAPVFGGRLQSVDTRPAESMPGVVRVVPLAEGVAVVADSYWHARQALAALRPRYDDAGLGDVSTDAIFAAFAQALGRPEVPEAPEGPQGPGAATMIAAEYRVPFLAHAAMEPLACTARVTGDRAEVWAGTQDPLQARAAAAAALGFSVDRVQFTNLPMGGSFGRRTPFCFDFIETGVRIAQAMAPAPVKVVWSRELDTQHDYYRPAAMARFAGALDAHGAPTAIACHYAGGGDRESLALPYAIADLRSADRDAPHAVRVGWWRSVLNSQHGFFKESFVDEMAHAAGQDPYRFRLDLLRDSPRARDVLVRAAALAGWGAPLPEGEGRGIALTESFGSIVAETAHVAISADGTLRVRQICAAIDCGDIVHPDGAAAQAEGAMLFGLSAAMLGEITIAGGRVVQSNFHDYPMIRLADTPDLRIEFLRSGAPLGGLGEACVPPVAPAVTNAIYAATGVRVRDLPIRNQPLARRITT